MKTKLAALSALVLLCAASAKAAMTTTVKFCDDASDNSTYTDNRAASGWSFTDIGANDAKSTGNYSHPVKFKGSTGAQSASTPAGSYLTQIDLGVWIGNTARTVTVTPLLESGSAGTAQTATPSSTSGLIEMPFSFPLANCVTGVTVSIAASGNSTAYLYYATVTTETPSGGGGNTAPEAMWPSVDVDATVGTEVTLDLENYFSDADGDSLTFALDSGIGDVVGPFWSFTPALTGSFSADVTATDPSGDSAVTTINVTVSDAVPPPLSSPTIEPVNPEDVTADGFILRWLAVENAMGYDLVVTNVAEQMEAGCQVSYEGPFPPDDLFVTATVTGLDADTAYEAAVRALSTSPDYTDSDWSYPVVIETILAGGLERKILIDEQFSEISGTWGYSRGYKTEIVGDAGTWTGNSAQANLNDGPSCLIVGRANTPGPALSPEIALSNNVLSAEVRISFRAAAHNVSSDSGLVLSIVDLDSGSTNQVASYSSLVKTFSDASSLDDISDSAHEETATAPERFKLLFETTGYGRVHIDSIIVSQIVDPSLAALEAPVPEFTAVGIRTLSAAWPEVAGAAGYAVDFRDASGTRVILDDTVARTNRDFAGLAWESAFSLRVRALGDGVTTCNSPWSGFVTTNTLENLDEPDFTVSSGAFDAVMATVSNKTFSVTAERAGRQVPVSFSAIDPEPAGAPPTFADGVFSWTPDAIDKQKTFTTTFSTDGGEYSTNVTFTVLQCPDLHSPSVELYSVEGNRLVALWDEQPRAINYAVRAWTGSPNLAATATRVEEPFVDFHEGVRPVGWIFKVSGSYDNHTTPVQFGANGNWMATYDLGGPISTVTFQVARNGGAAGRNSVLHLYASTGSTNNADWVELASWTDLDMGGDKAVSLDASAGYRRLFWQYAKPASNGGNVGVGSVVIEGKGFATAKFLPGWGPAAKDVGLVQACTVAPTRPGRTNWVEVSVTDGTKTFSRVKEIDVPDANPVTLLILK